jgi:hypothetical protein
METDDGWGTRDLQRREKLFGQNQFVLAGNAQQVALAGVINFNRAVAAQYFLAVEAGPEF